MSSLNELLQSALHASMEGSNLPVPRSVDLESELGEIESEIESLYEERQDVGDAVSTTAALECYLNLLEKEAADGTLNPSSIRLVQLGIESLFDNSSIEYSFESMGLESDAPDVGKFRQFVERLKRFVKKKNDEIAIKIRLIKQKIIPSVKGTARIVSDLRRIVDQMDPEAVPDQNKVFDKGDLDFDKLYIGGGRIETAPEIVQRYHNALTVLEEDWYDEFTKTYSTVTDSWKAMEVNSVFNFRKSLETFLAKHPPLLTITNKAGLLEAFESVGLERNVPDSAVIRQRKSWVSDNDPTELATVEFINNADDYFTAVTMSATIKGERLDVLGRVEMQALLSTMADDLKYLQDRERTLGRYYDPAFDDNPSERLGLFSNLGNGQRQLFNEFSAAVFHIVSVPWDYQTDLLLKMVRTYTALLRWIQLSINAHKTL